MYFLVVFQTINLVSKIALRNEENYSMDGNFPFCKLVKSLENLPTVKSNQ